MAEHRKDEKINRFDTSRAMQARENMKRGEQHMDWRDPLHIPQHYIPAGMEYRWINDTVMGDATRSNMATAAGSGWTPVPADRHPDLYQQTFLDRQPELRHVIHRKGLILCENELEVTKVIGAAAQKRSVDELSRVDKSLDNNLGAFQNLRNGSQISVKTRRVSHGSGISASFMS